MAYRAFIKIKTLPHEISVSLFGKKSSREGGVISFGTYLIIQKKSKNR